MNLPPSTNEPTLLGIPREIRNQIYALVLSRAYICRQYVDDPTHEDGGYIATTLQDADLLAVSRQVRAESQPVLQSSSTLQFDSYLFALSEDGSNHPVQQPATKELEAALHSNRKILVSFSGHILSIDTNFADRVLISDPNPQPYYSRDGTKALSGMERDVARVFRYHEGDITTAIGPEILHDWLEEGARLTGPAAASIINCIIKNFPCRKLHAWSHWSFCVQHPDPDETEDVPPGSVEVRFVSTPRCRHLQRGSADTTARTYATMFGITKSSVSA